MGVVWVHIKGLTCHIKEIPVYKEQLTKVRDILFFVVFVSVGIQMLS